MTTKTKTDWDSILLEIPGYDPHAAAGDFYFDEAAAQRAIDFFPACLKHVKGEWAGKPLVLEPWQQAIIGNLFGWKRPGGLRRYRTAFIYIPRKNSKSTMAAGLVVYLLFCDGEPGAEVYSAAAEREQASLVYNIAKGMVQQEPVLAKRCKIHRAARRILLTDEASFYTPISAETSSKHGYNATR